MGENGILNCMCCKLLPRRNNTKTIFVSLARRPSKPTTQLGSLSLCGFISDHPCPWFCHICLLFRNDEQVELTEVKHLTQLKITVAILTGISNPSNTDSVKRATMGDTTRAHTLTKLQTVANTNVSVNSKEHWVSADKGNGRSTVPEMLRMRRMK